METSAFYQGQLLKDSLGTLVHGDRERSDLMGSILSTIKKMLGLDIDYTDFDTDIIVLINSALMTLTQLGIGPSSGFSISDNSKTWTDFIGDSKLLEGVKAYVYMKVRIIFDPPTSATVLESINRNITELEARLNIQVETPISED
jgi:hypothetical protein